MNLKFLFAFEQFTMLLNINPLKKMFEEIFFLFMKSEMRKIKPSPPPTPQFFFHIPLSLIPKLISIQISNGVCNNNYSFKYIIKY